MEKYNRALNDSELGPDGDPSISVKAFDGLAVVQNRSPSIYIFIVPWRFGGSIRFKIFFIHFVTS